MDDHNTGDFYDSEGMDNISYASYTPTQPSYSSSALPNVTNYDPQYGKSNPFEQSTPYDQTVPSGSVAGYDEQIASGFTEHPQTGGGEDLSNATPMINETNVELEAWVRPGDQGSDPSEAPYGSATDAVDAPPHNFATGAGERTDPGPGEESSAMSHPGGLQDTKEGREKKRIYNKRTSDKEKEKNKLKSSKEGASSGTHSEGRVLPAEEASEEE
ncbi:uncharacterized protein PG998_004441 [Apiospora kogelbergensis]|uniref:uncharacterized protein n=1 Tax=Apiospora kogelbergensis TaxID=1337665 RepID=UPI0031303B24